MDTSNIRSNSISSRQKKPEENNKKAVIPEGAATKIAKPTKGEKLMEDANAIKDYVKSETPGLAKRFLRELLQGLLNTFLPGGSGPNRSTYSSNGTVMTEYNRAGGYNYAKPGATRASNSVYAYEALYFEEFEYADTILNDMKEEVSSSGYVTVFDMYQFAGTECNSTDMNYGWYNLNDANVIMVPDGRYKLALPRPVPIRR